MNEDAAKNCHPYAPISQRLFLSQKVIHWTQRMNKKLLAQKN